MDFKGMVFTSISVTKVGKLLLFHGTDKPQKSNDTPAFVLGLQTEVLKISCALTQRTLQDLGQLPPVPSGRPNC